MDLDKLLAEVNQKKGEAEARARQIAGMQVQMNDTMEGNYTTIIKPIWEKYNSILESICNNHYKECPSEYADTMHSTHPETNEDVWIELKFRGSDIVINGSSTSNMNYWNPGWSDKETSAHHAERFRAYSLYNFFANEECAQKFIDRLTDMMVNVLSKYSINFDKTNAEYAQCISNLAEALKTAHTVEEKEDGTVEIQLGGKTYIGRVKEA